MSVTLEVDGLDSLEDMIANLPQIREAGVAVDGERAVVASVWEWGSARIHKPGPKTMWGENPDGDRVVLTITAPHGYIRVHHELYVQILQKEFGAIAWGSLPLSQWPAAIDTMLTNAARQCSQLISESAPIDTGLLRASIHPIAPGDSLLDEDEDTSFDLGEDWAA
jgi:hypothetical protein